MSTDESWIKPATNQAEHFHDRNFSIKIRAKTMFYALQIVDLWKLLEKFTN